MAYNREAIRQLIDESFDDADLRVFCSDHYNDIFTQFASGQHKSDRVLRLVDRVAHSGEFNRFLGLIRQKRPEKVAEFENRLQINVPMLFVRRTWKTIRIIWTGFWYGRVRIHVVVVTLVIVILFGSPLSWRWGLWYPSRHLSWNEKDIGHAREILKIPRPDGKFPTELEEQIAANIWKEWIEQAVPFTPNQQLLAVRTVPFRWNYFSVTVKFSVYNDLVIDDAVAFLVKSRLSWPRGDTYRQMKVAIKPDDKSSGEICLTQPDSGEYLLLLIRVRGVGIDKRQRGLNLQLEVPRS